MNVQVECRDVVKQLGASLLINELNWTIPAGNSVGLLGESGIGKTTALRLIAGLEEATAGTITFSDENGNRISRSKLRISFLFQDLAMWPHVTVRDHIRLVLPERNDPKNVAEILTHCQIPLSLWERYPDCLSGGEAQRVAMARALAGNPNILMVDEPFSNIDLNLRTQIKQCLRDYVEKRGITFICVSHQWDDLADICQSVSVLADGRIVQDGTVSDVYWKPLNSRIARLTGALIEIPTHWIERGYIYDPLNIYERHWMRLGGIRPQSIYLKSPEENNAWEAIHCYPRSLSWLIELKSSAGKIRCYANHAVKPGEKVGIAIRSQ